MTAWVQAALTVRRSARGSFGYLAVFGLGLLVLLGLFREPRALGIEHAVVAIGWAAAVIARLSARARSGGGLSRAEGLLDMELGLLALCAAHALLQLVRRAASPLAPLLFGLAGVRSAPSPSARPCPR